MRTTRWMPIAIVSMITGCIRHPAPSAGRPVLGLQPGIAVAAIDGSVLRGDVPMTLAPGDQGPWNHGLVIATSRDGKAFTSPRPFVERAGVPTLVRQESGRLVAAFQWFPLGRPQSFDRVAVSRSSDGGETWSEPESIEFDDYPRQMIRPFDPALVSMSDGRLRLYFTSRTKNEPPATYSAISRDGRRWTVEPGVRFGVRDAMVIDPAVVRTGTRWHYFAPVQGTSGRSYHATSRDGLTFDRQEDIVLDGAGSWLGGGIERDSELRFYGTGSAGSSGWLATSEDGYRWRLEPGTSWVGDDPGVASGASDSWVMISCGPPRADAGPLPEGTRPPPDPDSEAPAELIPPDAPWKP